MKLSPGPIPSDTLTLTLTLAPRGPALAPPPPPADRLFPYDPMFRWLSYGNDPHSKTDNPAVDRDFFMKREWSFTLAGEWLGGWCGVVWGVGVRSSASGIHAPGAAAGAAA